MLIDVIVFFLGFSMVFYVLFGGADFGAGILEIISGKKDRETIAHAIGPVWEANHVWLILIVVILFMAFPKVYTVMSTHLHIPLLIMLLGIVLRGTAFTYMHYDAIQDRSNHVYNFVFKASSVLTPFFLGIIAGGVSLGKINPEAGSFSEAFIEPWLNLYSVSVGLFTVTIFTFLAAVYLIGETEDKSQRRTFTIISRYLNFVAVLIGALVFLSAEWSGFSLLTLFWDTPFSIAMVIAATVLLPAIWWSLKHVKVILSRILAALQTVCILTAWFWAQHPVIINLRDGFSDLTFQNAAAPESTQIQLVWALIVGSCIILPFLFYLMKVFKGKQFDKNDLI